MPRQLQRGQPRGAKHPRASLTEEDVHTIRERLAAGERQAAIARDYNISASQVSRIKTGKNWGTQPLTTPARQGSARASAKLTEEDIPVILLRIEHGDSISKVARAYRVGRTTIADIWHGRRWKHVPRSTPMTRRKVYEEL